MRGNSKRACRGQSLFEKLESRHLLAAIVSGQTVLGHIASAAQRDKYTFPGKGGGSIVASIGALNSILDGEVQVFDPTGKLLGTAMVPDQGHGDQSTTVTVTGTVDGTYYVVASGAFGTEGSYKLAVASVPETQFSDSQDGPVTSGQTISGDMDGELHAYSFPGKGGGSIVASIGALNSILDGEVQVFDPTGKLLGTAMVPDQGHGDQSTTVTVTGTVDGTYYVVASGAFGTEGSYKLAVASVPETQFSDSQDGPVTSGQTISGDMDGELHAYSFPGKGGGSIVASIGALNSILDGEVQVFDPTGKLLGTAMVPDQGHGDQSTTVTVTGTVDGTYYVVASGAFGTEGSYKLAVASVPETQFSDSQDGPVTSGQTISGDMDGELHAYSFPGKGGGSIVASIGALNSILDGEVQVFDPTGKLLGTAMVPDQGHGDQSTTVTVTGTVDGTYYVVASGAFGTEGSYKLAVASVPETQFSDSQDGPVTSGQTISGDMDGELHAYSFPGKGGGSIVASIGALNSILDGEVQVFDPTGKLLGTAMVPDQGHGDQSTTVTVTGTVDGTYYVVASGAFGTEGGYKISVTYSPLTTLPKVSVAATDSTASEPGTDTGSFTISRAGKTSSALTVKYTISGSATNGTDYNSLSGTATIPAGSLTAAIVVTPKDDKSVEPTETVVLTLASGSGYMVGSPSSATVSILDNDTPADPDDQISEAHSLGAMTNDHSALNANIANPTDVNMYSFTVATNQRVAFDVDHVSGSALDSYLRLFNSSGTQLASNDNGLAPNETGLTKDSWLQYTFTKAGTYYVGVSGAQNSKYSATSGTGDVTGSTGHYNLFLSVTGGGAFAGISGNAINGNAQSPVSINRADGTINAIDPTKTTWVLIHGWHSDPSALASIASALAAERPSDQVLTVNWQAAANAGVFPLNVLTVESWIPHVAAWVAGVLSQHGFSALNLNFIGHSFGSYISGETAKLLGGVNDIVALDPAGGIGSVGYNPDSSINFKNFSKYSWAFYSRDWSLPVPTGLVTDDATTSGTADEAIDVLGASHISIPTLFANILGRPDAVSQEFSLSRLMAAKAGPWKQNQYYTNGGILTGIDKVFEATLSTVAGIEPNQLTYVSASSGLQTTVNATLISGTVFNNLIGDGKHHPGEQPLVGWRVFLDNGDGKWETSETSVLTDSSGDWSFAGLAPGTYKILVVPQTGWVLANPVLPMKITLTAGGYTLGNWFEEHKK